MAGIRSFGVQTMAAAASQPVFGTTMSAAGVLIPDQYSGNTNPGSNQSLSYLTLTSVTGFRVGDLVVVGPKASFSAPVLLTAPLDTGTIKKIAGSVVTVQGLISSHASGEYVLLNEEAAFVYVIPRVNTALLYLGTASTVAVADASTFDVLPIYTGSGAVPYYHQSSASDRTNPYKTSEFWINGAQNDTFIARYTQV